MMKKTIAIMFMFLLLLSMSVATASAYDWRRRTEPDLPSDVVPYDIAIDSVTTQGWWMTNVTYKGIYVILLTAESFSIEGMTVSIFDQAVSSMAGTNLATYATEINIDWITITPDMVENPEDIALLKELLGDPSTLTGVTLKVVCMTADGVSLSGVAQVTCPDVVKTTVKSQVLSGYDIEEGECCGLDVTVISAKKATVKGEVMTVAGDCDYTLEAPGVVMVNSEICTTYVKGWALGFIYVSWSGSNIPWLVELAKLMFKQLSMTSASMGIVSLVADSLTMTSMKLDISA